MAKNHTVSVSGHQINCQSFVQVMAPVLNCLNTVWTIRAGVEQRGDTALVSGRGWVKRGHNWSFGSTLGTHTVKLSYSVAQSKFLFSIQWLLFYSIMLVWQFCLKWASLPYFFSRLSTERPRSCDQIYIVV